MLENEERSGTPEFRVKEVQYIHAEDDLKFIFAAESKKIKNRSTVYLTLK